MTILQNLTIKRRLQINALVVGLAMIVMLFIIIYEARVMLKLNETIQYAEELDIHELSMRKYEKDFLFYNNNITSFLFFNYYLEFSYNEYFLYDSYFSLFYKNKTIIRLFY